MNVVDYHLKELAIARNPSHERFALPNLLEKDVVIVDIGCGVGQCFVALECLDKTCIGIDIDADAIKYGQEHFGSSIEFHLAKAETLPIDSRVADLVIARTTLQYTNIPKALAEISRILRPGGRVWLTLHEKKRIVGRIREAIHNGKITRSLFSSYVLLNGYLFLATGRVLPFFNGQYESWQDINKMERLLKDRGFLTRRLTYNSVTAIEGILVTDS